MWKTLLLTAATLATAQVTVEATAIAGDPCQTSGISVDRTLKSEDKAPFGKMPQAVQDGMLEHQRVLGIDIQSEWPEWPELPDCSAGQHSWTCQGSGWFCQCIHPPGSDWHCGCETGQC